jgi:hypothetical protein
VQFLWLNDRLTYFCQVVADADTPFSGDVDDDVDVDVAAAVVVVAAVAVVVVDRSVVVVVGPNPTVWSN